MPKFTVQLYSRVVQTYEIEADTAEAARDKAVNDGYRLPAGETEILGAEAIEVYSADEQDMNRNNALINEEL
jgi:hypothetical protein